MANRLLDMGARIAARFHSHCPQTARLYYKPPQTPPIDGTDEKGVNFLSEGFTPAGFARFDFLLFDLGSEINGGMKGGVGFDTTRVLLYSAL